MGEPYFYNIGTERLLQAAIIAILTLNNTGKQVELSKIVSMFLKKEISELREAFLECTIADSTLLDQVLRIVVYQMLSIDI